MVEIICSNFSTSNEDDASAPASLDCEINFLATAMFPSQLDAISATIKDSIS